MIPYSELHKNICMLEYMSFSHHNRVLDIYVLPSGAVDCQ
jgi:hypothetical protein